MSNVHELKPYPKLYSENVIAVLEESLEAARNGEYVHVGIAMVRRDGSIRNQRSKGDGTWTLVGAMFDLMHQVCNDTDKEGNGG